jgi:hypothetical protein
VQQSNDLGISFNKGNFTFSPNMKKNATTSLAGAEVSGTGRLLGGKHFCCFCNKKPLSVDLFKNQQPK